MYDEDGLISQKQSTKGGRDVFICKWEIEWKTKNGRYHKGKRWGDI